MRLDRLYILLLPLWVGCNRTAPELPEIPSPIKMASAKIQPIARMVQAQGLVLRRGGGLVMEVSANSADSHFLHQGLTADVTDLRTGATWACQVTDVLANASLETGASVAWLEPVSGTGSLKEGDFVSASILAQWLQRGLVVPSAAVLIHGGRTVVVVSRKDEAGKEALQPVDVSLGVDSGDYTQILKGLKDGEQVVVEGGTGYLAPEFKSHPAD